MDLIDRYVLAVTERLPENTREDVAKELRSNIEDMLPENASESDVRIVLEKLGNPAALANEYRQVKRYLIGPALYDNYVSVLKLVIGIAVVAFMFLSVLGGIEKSGVNGGSYFLSAEFFRELIAAGFDGVIQAFVWVTIVFAVLERTGVSSGDLPFGKKQWTVEELQNMPLSPKSRISRGDAIASIIFTVVFVALLVFQPQLFGMYSRDGSGMIHIAPVLQLERLQLYIPFIVLFAIFQLVLSIGKLITMRWTRLLAFANTVNNLVSSIFVCIMLGDSLLYNPELTSTLAGIFHMTAARIAEIKQASITAFIVVFIIIAVVDSINGLVRSRAKSQGIQARR